MKKITGKALSLVLSLALVVSSFSLISASASTRTADGIVSDTDQDKIYLVNGGENDDAKQSRELNAWIQEKLQTKTRDDVDDVKVNAISHVSGDSLVSLKTTNDGDDAYLKLKSKSVKGTEVISILYKGTYTDDDGNDYTVKARKNFTVYVYDKDAPILAEVKDSGNPSVQPGTDTDNPTGVHGKGLDPFKTFAKTRNTVKTVGLYLAEPAEPGVNATLKYAPIYVTTDKNGVSGASDGKLGDVTLKDSAFYLDISDGDSDVHYNTDTTGGTLKQDDKSDSTKATRLQQLNGSSSNAFKLVSGSGWNDTLQEYTKDASTSNVTFTLKRLKTDGSVSSSSDDKYTLKTKVEKKVDVAQAYYNDKADAAVTTAAPTVVWSDPALPTSWTVKKSNGRTRLDGIYDRQSSDYKNNNNKYLDVTDCILDFPNSTNTDSVSIGDDEDSVNVKGIIGYVGSMDIGEEAHVGSIDIEGGKVEVNGKVGNITTDDKSGIDGDGSVTVKGDASVGDIDTGDADTSVSTGAVEIDGGTVGAVDVHDGTGKLTIDGQDSDDAITTGVVSAPEMDIYSDEANVTIAGIKANDENGTLDLQGDGLTIKSIDLDSYNTNLQIGDDDEDDKAFTGTLPAIQNASNATIKTENEDTKATISGDVNADTVDLDSDTSLTFGGKVQAATIEGDGTITVGAGKLYVTDSVSSTKLKLSDPTLAVGTTVFTSKTDTVAADDFECYGFTLTKSEGNTVDTFKIASLNFAGLQITGSTNEILPGQSVTYTASAYPGGTTVPTGYTVEWELDGGSSDVFTLTTNGNAATVKVNKLDPTFASENKTTLTATLYDEDGYEAEDYEPATFDITATATPTQKYKSDTTGTVNLKVGGTYQFKITSPDGSTPNFVVAGGGANVTATSRSGNDFFFKVTGLKVGQYGVYVSSSTARTAILNITSDAKIDTTVVTIKAGNVYQFKVTSSAKPSFGVGSSAATVVSSSSSGNNYFYKVKASGKAGDKVGVYVNGARLAIITVG